MKPPEVVASGWAITKTGGTKSYHVNNWTKYKITEADFSRLWTQQNGRCGVCETPLAHPTFKAGGMGVRCVVDHKHRLGERLGTITPDQVRGLLCRNCNELLGVVRESVHTLEGAARWIRERGFSEWEHEEAPVAKPVERFDEVEVTELDGTKTTIRRYY